MDEVGAKFNTLSKNEQAYITTAMFGTFQRNKGLTLLKNYDQSLKNYETALNSAGTAEQKYNIRQESTQAHMDKLRASIEGFWQSTVDSSLIKGTLDVATGLVNTLGNLPTILSLIASGFALWKGSAISSSLIANFVKLTAVTKGASVAQGLLSNSFVQTTLRANGMTFAEMGALAATTKLSFSFKALGASIVTAFMSNPIGIIVTALTSAVMVMDIFKQKQEEANRKMEESISKTKEEINSLSDLKKQYTEIASSGDLTTESKSRLKNIQDQLIKTYGIEANAIDLVNGKYKDQIKVIDEATAKKYEDLKRSMGATGLQSKNALYDKNTTDIKVDSFSLINPNAYSAENLLGTSGLDKAISDLQKKYAGKLIFDDKNALTGDSFLKVNGTLADRVKILGELSTAVTSVAEKDKAYESIANDIANQYNTLNEELNKNTEIWNKYAEADFYSKYKTQISEVHDLQNQLLNEKDTNKKSAIESQIDIIKDKITGSKGYITDYKGFVEDLFNAISDSSNKASDDVSNANKNNIKSFEDMTKEVKNVVSSVKELNDIQADLSKGNKLTADSVVDLITKYPDLINYIHKTADGYEVEAKGMDIVRNALVNKQMIALETESGITQAMKTYLSARLDMYGIELESIRTLNDARNASEEMFANVPEYVANNAGFKNYQSTVKTQLESIAKLNTLKDLLTSGLKTGVKEPKSKSTSTSASQEISEKVALKDRYYDLNHEIDKYNALISKQKAEYELANDEKKIQILNKEIETYEKLQNVIHRKAEAERKERSEIVSSLKKQGVKTSGSGDDITLTNATSILEAKANQVNKHTGDPKKTVYKQLKSQYDDLESAVSRFFDIQDKELPQLIQDWNGYKKTINDTKLDKISLSFEVFNETLEPANRQLKELEHRYNMLGESDIDEKEKNINKQLLVKANMLNDINRKISEYQKLLASTKIGAEKELYQQQIDSLKSQAYELSESFIESSKKANDDKLDLYNDTIDKIKDLLKKQNDLEEKALDDSLDKYKEYVQGIIDERDRLYEKEDYEESINESNTKIAELQSEIDKRRMAAMQGDLVAANEISEFQKQKAEEEKNLKDKQKDWERKKTKENLEDQIDYYEDYTKDQKKILEEKTTDVALQLQAESILAQQNISDVQNSINTLFNITGENATKAGQLLQQEIISRLKEIMDIQANLDSITALSSQITGTGGTESQLSYEDRIKQQMRENSNAYGSASKEEKQRLSDENLELGTSLGWYRDNAGYWYDETGKLAQYANGTTNAKGGLSQVDEGTKGLNGVELRVLGKGDGIVTADLTKNLNTLAMNVPNILQSITSNLSMPQLVPISNMGSITIGDININGVNSVDKNTVPILQRNIINELKLQFNRGGTYRK